MEIVASKFERDGLIDYKEFVNSLKDKKPVSAISYQFNSWHLKGELWHILLGGAGFVVSGRAF